MQSEPETGLQLFREAVLEPIAAETVRDVRIVTIYCVAEERQAGRRAWSIRFRPEAFSTSLERAIAYVEWMRKRGSKWAIWEMPSLEFVARSRSLAVVHVPQTFQGEYVFASPFIVFPGHVRKSPRDKSVAGVAGAFSLPWIHKFMAEAPLEPGKPAYRLHHSAVFTYWGSWHLTWELWGPESEGTLDLELSQLEIAVDNFRSSLGLA